MQQNIQEPTIGNTKGLFIQSAKANSEHDFSLFYFDQRCQACINLYKPFCINRP